MTIYTNKAQFIPLVILLSILFVPAIIVLIVLCILYQLIQFFVILLCFILIFCLAICAVRKESNSRRNYIKINENTLVIKNDSFSSENVEVFIDFNNIVQIDYYGINSIISWVGIICLQCPNTALISFVIDGQVIQKALGFFEKDEIKKICSLCKIKLIVH